MLEKRMLQELQEIQEKINEFLEKRRELMWEMIFQNQGEAEACLRAEIISELEEKLSRTAELIDYLGADVKTEGTLHRSPDGSLFLGERRLEPGQEIEIFIYEPLFHSDVWTRVRVSAEEVQRLIGVGRNVDIEGVKGRIRG